jgi:hypothetical protein
MPKVDFVSREINRTIISVFPGTFFNTPMYLPPAAETIEKISASFKLGSMVFEPLVLARTYPSFPGLRIRLQQFRRRRLKLAAGGPMPYFRIRG